MSWRWVREIRPRALARADFKCENCEATLLLEVHHIDGNPFNNAAQNLRVLCDDCHVAAHLPEAKDADAQSVS
jgi:5-methylcytosine-specific restriction endonuclease McrA